MCMLTNERRAHDLALMIVEYQLRPDVLKMEIEESVTKSLSHMQINIVDMYSEAYNMALEAINKRFP